MLAHLPSTAMAPEWHVPASIVRAHVQELTFWRGVCNVKSASLASWEPSRLAARLATRCVELESVGFSSKDAGAVIARGALCAVGRDGKLATSFDRLHAVLCKHLDGTESRLALCAAIRTHPHLSSTLPTVLESAIDAVVAASLAPDRVSAAQELLQRPRAIKDGSEVLRRAACARMFGFDNDSVWTVVQRGSYDRWIARAAFALSCGCAPAICAGVRTGGTDTDTVRASCTLVVMCE